MATTIQSRKNKNAKQDRVDVRLMQPGKYEVSPDDTFTIDIFLKKKESRWILVDGKEKGVFEESVVMRMWTYDESIELRKMATSYDATKRIHMIDQDALNRLKLQKFLVSWTFGKDNERLLLHHHNGTLTDESWKSVTKLQPNILEYIIQKMNAVYEYNG
jgi:hypothetical protein